MLKKKEENVIINWRNVREFSANYNFADFCSELQRDKQIKIYTLKRWKKKKEETASFLSEIGWTQTILNIHIQPTLCDKKINLII